MVVVAVVVDGVVVGAGVGVVDVVVGVSVVVVVVGGVAAVAAGMVGVFFCVQRLQDSIAAD